MAEGRWLKAEGFAGMARSYGGVAGFETRLTMAAGVAWQSHYSLVADDEFIRDDDGEIVGVKPEVEAAIKKEMADITARAKADGTFGKAPNGEKSKLTDGQWVMVRTERFKKWFGDWEKPGRIKKLKDSEPISINSRDIKGYTLNRKSAQQYILNNFRGEPYINKDTGDKIIISRIGALEVTSHSAMDENHLKSIGSIPELIQKSIFLDEGKPERDKDRFDNYRYYIAGLEIDGEPHTVRITIGEKGNKKYYDHSLTQIEKGGLIRNIDELSSPFDPNQNTFSGIKDSRLLAILQDNSSKVVDENGEPLVVYHGSANDIVEFKFKRGAYFSADKERAQDYADARTDDESGGVITEAFLNIRNPEVMDGMDDNDFERFTDTREEDRYVTSRGFDGQILNFETDPLSNDLRVTRPSQIKSAIGNAGTWSDKTGKIQFQQDEEIPPGPPFAKGGEAAGESSALSPQPSDLSHRPGWLKRLIENHPGVKAWNFLSKTGPEWAGEKSDLIDKVNAALITGYREDAAFSRLRKDTEVRLLARQEKAKELARILATFPDAEQARIGQIIEGSVTMAPKRYAAALKVAEEFKALEAELQELGLLGPENRFRQLTRKELGIPGTVYITPIVPLIPFKPVLPASPSLYDKA